MARWRGRSVGERNRRRGVSSVVNDKAFANGKGVKGKKKEQVITTWCSSRVTNIILCAYRIYVY